jgi:hypothetical protein
MKTGTTVIIAATITVMIVMMTDAMTTDTTIAMRTTFIFGSWVCTVDGAGSF